MMLDLTTTTCRVNEFSIRERLAKAERFHSLTRTDEVPVKQPSALTRLAARLVVIPVHRTLAPQH